MERVESDVTAGLMGYRSLRAGSRLTLVPLAVALLVVSVAGCASTLALDRAVVAYDTTTTDSVAKLLLLNIARARHNQPMHFTGISSVAATYKFSVNAGFGGALTGNQGGLIVPVFGASAEENPTISITPIQGEEFTQRLLTPFQEQKLTLLLRQGYDVDLLLRLLGAEIRLENNEHLSVCGPAAERLSMEPEGFQPALSIVPDDRGRRAAVRTSNHHLQVTPNTLGLLIHRNVSL